jgi:dihydropteroate synthase
MVRQFHWDTSRTLIMGALNVTPDSFSMWTALLRTRGKWRKRVLTSSTWAGKARGQARRP